MQLPFVRRSRHIFLCYGLIISALSLYAFHLHREKEREHGMYHAWMQTVKQTDIVIEKIEAGGYHNISHARNLDPYAANDSLLNQALFLQKIREQTNKSITEEMYRSFHVDKTPDNILPFFKNVLSDPLHRQTFFKHQKSFADTLYAFAASDSLTRRSIDHFFSPMHDAAITNILNGNRDDQKAVLLTIIQLTNGVAASQSMTGLKSQMRPYRLTLEDILPSLWAYQSCVHAGEIFKGDVSLLNYSIKSSNITMSVNDQPIPIVQGLGKFKQIYKTPGVKHLRSEIKVTNPFTGDARTYRKDFSLTIR